MIPSIKKGVKIDLLSPRMALAFGIITHIYCKFNEPECRITSGNDGSGVHMVGSKHFIGEALDIGLPKDGRNWSIICATIKASLGENFDVIHERTHYHVEYDPKTAVPVKLPGGVSKG
jgi:hypothetical protein